MNAEYIKRVSVPELTLMVKEYLEKENFPPPGTDERYLQSVIELVRERLVTLHEFRARTYFCFYDDYEYGPETAGVLAEKKIDAVRALRTRLAGLDAFDRETVEKNFRDVTAQLGLKARDLVHPARAALTGQKSGPGLFETMEVLGKTKVVARLDRLLAYWNASETGEEGASHA